MKSSNSRRLIGGVDGGMVKAITLWQPWASLIAYGLKTYETRTWSTKYRGPLAIHAAKREAIKYEALDWPFDVRTDVLARLGQPDYLPRGAVICICDLVDCRPTDVVGPELTNMNVFFGDYSPGRFAWELANVRRVGPFPARGSQGFWDWDPLGAVESAEREEEENKQIDLL